MTEVGQETREKIAEAALAVFSENGFEGATTRAIAARAKVNLGLIKYYFGTKEKLWKTALTRVHERMAAEFVVGFGAGAAQKRDLPEGDRDLLEQVIRGAVRFAAANPGFVRIMNDEGKRKGPRMRWLADQHGKPMFEQATGLFERARSAGHLPDVAPLHLYYMFLGAVGLIFSQAPECKRLTGTDPTIDEATIEAHADAVVALFLRG